MSKAEPAADKPNGGSAGVLLSLVTMQALRALQEPVVHLFQ